MTRLRSAAHSSGRSERMVPIGPVTIAWSGMQVAIAALATSGVARTLTRTRVVEAPSSVASSTNGCSSRGTGCTRGSESITPTPTTPASLPARQISTGSPWRSSPVYCGARHQMVSSRSSAPSMS